MLNPLPCVPSLSLVPEELVEVALRKKALKRPNAHRELIQTPTEYNITTRSMAGLHSYRFLDCVHAVVPGMYWQGRVPRATWCTGRSVERAITMRLLEPQP